MTKKNCTQYAKKYPGYPCNDEFFNGNHCVCSYKEQPLGEHIGCEDQNEGRCKTKEYSARYMTDSKGYTCNDELCKGDDCGCKYKEQLLCEDIDYEDQKEGKYMTKNNCK